MASTLASNGKIITVPEAACAASKAAVEYRVSTTRQLGNPSFVIAMHINPERSTRPDYDLLVRQVASVLEGERDLTANASQFSALVYDTLADLNWAGFYLTVPSKKGEGEDLLVGPFQGKPACARIPFGRGVCGTTAVKRETIVVADVHAFPGHIACDSASASEIVLPVIKNGKLVGVFDIDSPSLNRFSDEDKAGLEAMVAAFVEATDC
jgi:L-methionine (R)-S-oxide reductase